MDDVLTRIRKSIEESSYETNEEYTKEEIEKAVQVITDFIVKLRRMTVEENGRRRALNELEKFLAINEFVTNRVYQENEKGERLTSHNIVGVCNTGKAVCEGFCGLMHLLCSIEGIPVWHKMCEAENKKTGISNYHGNLEVCIKDKEGNVHCLHVDPTIDCLDEKDILTYNATLIPDSNINKYRAIQRYTNCNTIWLDLFNGTTPEHFAEVIKPTDMELISAELYGRRRQDIEQEKINAYGHQLIDMAEALRISVDEDIETAEQAVNLYRAICEVYEVAKEPIDNSEFLEALINVQTAYLEQDESIPAEKVSELSRMQIKARIEKSIEMQNNGNWDRDADKSFIVDIVNGKFDYMKQLQCADLNVDR
ncbi:MAG: transglutaminase domain-containing protein [Clostridia bacterium]|nr:transglutaminase domain-containing protein [Clostridia bacterium]